MDELVRTLGTIDMVKGVDADGPLVSAFYYHGDTFQGMVINPVWVDKKDLDILRKFDKRLTETRDGRLLIPVKDPDEYVKLQYKLLELLQARNFYSNTTKEKRRATSDEIDAYYATVRKMFEGFTRNFDFAETFKRILRERSSSINCSVCNVSEGVSDMCGVCRAPFHEACWNDSDHKITCRIKF